jgi:hypothetical protein
MLVEQQPDLHVGTGTLLEVTTDDGTLDSGFPMLLRRVTILGSRTTPNQLVTQRALKQHAVNIAIASTVPQ